MAWGRRTPSAQTPAWNQDDYHTAFAGKLKEQIEQGVASWQKPWKPGEERLPKNIQTDKPYRGGNSIYLSVTQTAKGYSDNRWATYKQIKDMGGQVRKGEKATHVLFYKFDDERKKEQEQPDRPATEGKAEREHTRPPMVRCYAVFNVEQADGLTLERKGDDREPPPEWKAHQTAERVIQESGIRVVHERGDRAFYNMQTDKVTLPEREQFATANGYYQTALHELGHATGHPDRMDRDTLKHGVGNFGGTEYAREELRAEMSAMMTGERVGVGHDGTRGAAYVQGWIKALEDDPKEIYKAAADAQKSPITSCVPSGSANRRPRGNTASWPTSTRRRAVRRSATRRSRSPSGSQASAARRSLCSTDWISFVRTRRRPGRRVKTRRARTRRDQAHPARTALPARTGPATSRGPAIVGNTTPANGRAAVSPNASETRSPTWGSIAPCPTQTSPSGILTPTRTPRAAR